MAAFDLNDIIGRLQRWLPQGWFPIDQTDDTGRVNRIYAQNVGAATILETTASENAYVAQQTRISTAADGFLDLASADFFGSNLPRKASEGDVAFQARILAALLPDGATRAALIAKLTALTGHAPRVFEPRNPGDTGGYDVGGVGYDTAGGYGDMNLPYQAFVTAYRPSGGGVANVMGYYEGSGWAGGGYDQGAIQYIDDGMISGQITDDDIQQAVAAVIPEGTLAWMNITNAA